jgi:hypothetical protein
VINEYHLAFWPINLEKPYYDAPHDEIKMFKLLKDGYGAFCFSSFSNYERKILRSFEKRTDTFVFKDCEFEEPNSEIGKYKDISVIIMTKNPVELVEIVNNIPARNIRKIVDKKKRYKYQNYKHVIGDNGIMLSYTDPQNIILHQEYEKLLKVMRKLTA